VGPTTWTYLKDYSHLGSESAGVLMAHGATEVEISRPPVALSEGQSKLPLSYHYTSRSLVARLSPPALKLNLELYH